MQEGHQERSRLWAVVRAVFVSQVVPTLRVIKAGERKGAVEEHKAGDPANKKFAFKSSEGDQGTVSTYSRPSERRMMEWRPFRLPS